MKKIIGTILFLPILISLGIIYEISLYDYQNYKTCHSIENVLEKFMNFFNL